MDVIHLEELIVDICIGVEAEERNESQPVAMDVSLFLNLASAAAKDELQATVSYSELEKIIISRLKGKTYKLMERLAMDVIEICFSYPSVNKVRVKTWKPHRPIMSKRAWVEMTRSRDE